VVEVHVKMAQRSVMLALDSFLIVGMSFGKSLVAIHAINYQISDEFLRVPM